MTDSAPELVKGFAAECDKLGFSAEGLHSGLECGQMAKRGTCAHWKTEWLPRNKAESRRPRCRKRLHVIETWTKVSEEVDGLGKAAKGQHYNIIVVSEKE